MGDLIGKRVPMVDGPAKAAGCIVYGADFGMRGMLWGKVFRSPLPHARISNIDTSKAEKLPGVYTVITGRSMDFPGYTLAGQKVVDDRVLPLDKVRFVGDEIAAVAARDADTAEEAVGLIEVDFEELTPVMDPLDALAPGAPLVHESFGTNVAAVMDFERGDPRKAFLQADVVVEDEFYTPMVHQGYLEPHSVVASWEGDRVTIWAPMQSPELGRITYANGLGIGSDQVRVIQMPMGGAFGGKLEYKLHMICAALARIARRPVKMVNTREEEFLAGTPRMPMRMKMRVGAKSDGTLLCKDAHIIADNGAFTNYGVGILLSAAHRHDNLYRFGNIHTRAELVWTNKPGSGCYRGFGNPQSHFAFESILDMLADELGMDPAELRLKNATQTGDFTAHGWVIGSCGLSDAIRESTKAAGWKNKWRRSREAASPDTERFARGIGIACCLHVSGNRTFLPYFDGASAYVRINEQGKVVVQVSETDLGQGARTVFAQMAAHELGIPVEDVEVARVDTDHSPHGLGTFADRATTLGGNAVKKAAEAAREKLLAHAAQAFAAQDVSVERTAAGGSRGLSSVRTKRPINKDDLRIEDGVIYLPDDPDLNMTFEEAARQYSYDRAGATLIAEGSFVVPGVSMVDPNTKYGNISCAYPFVAQVAEVEVDRLTGEVKLLGITAAHDLGKVINPLLSEGQVQGALAQGIGFALSEEMVFTDGIPGTRSFRAYHAPRITDMPPLTTMFIESDDPVGPYGAKGLAEPALTPTAPAIANAVYNAVGVRVKELPVTPAKVLAGLDELTGEGKEERE
jgi:CO/xanthine dehydrogenase Mo-binding subunit